MFGSALTDAKRHKEALMVAKVGESKVLRPGRRSYAVLDFEQKLRDKIVGQDEAVTELVNIYQSVLADMATPGRPVANLLFLGPTGSGKTRLVEAAAEALFSTADAVTKIDCAEFQHSHEIAKLIGSPPGYIGHRETQAVLNQEAIDRYHTETLKLSFVLFDEIEKASDALWQLLLGILDKGNLTLGDNHKVDLSRSIIFMTSNLGTSEISRLMSGGIGFAPPHHEEDSSHLEQKIHRVAVDAARRRFSPEFMNRIDKVAVFRALNKAHLEKVLDIELHAVQQRILDSQTERPFVLTCAVKAREFLLSEGTDPKYGARHLKRAIEHHLVLPLASLLATGQIASGDVVSADLAENGTELSFEKTQICFQAAAAGGVIESSAIL
jgi:ATP-dependent Clp protease ATP-binding subunit ClpB